LTESAPRDAAFCFDRYAVHAVGVERGDLRWRWGVAAADPGAFQDDPEVLDGWVAAAATRAGLVVVNRDGRVCLLSLTDGRLIWEVTLERLPLVHLRATDSYAAVVWRSGGQVKLAMLPLKVKRPTVTPRDLGDEWPVWCTALESGFLAVRSQEAIHLPLDREPGVTKLDGIRAKAGSVDVAKGIARLLVGSGRAVRAYDPLVGADCWVADEVAGPRTEIQTLDVCADHFIATDGAGVSVGELRSGRVVGRFERTGADIVGSSVSRGWLFVVYRERADRRRLMLARVRLAAKAGRRELARFVLGSSQEVREVLWTDEGLTLVAPRAISVYRLPLSD
jgi:hypothetical protein